MAKKNIDLDDTTKKKLMILAAHAGKDLKNYIQDHLKEHAEKTKLPKQ